ncbi:translocon-associated protein subunit gamma-like [Chironomus tepperi]|uniref:translocon-associated protein subunit gamma-like n=1 Tax=Chironomus tepperi TaxID=113505 RepID=UPI00391FB78B
MFQEKKSSMFTKEEEWLLQDFNRNVSTGSNMLFYGSAAIISALPIWLYWRIYQMELLSSLIIFVAFTAISTYLMAMAYRNTKFTLKHKVAMKREDTVTREIAQLLADDKMSRKEKDERILWKKNEIADFEATVFSIFYNNVLFLALMIFLSFYLLRSISPTFNYMITISGTSGLLALLSASTSS